MRMRKTIPAAALFLAALQPAGCGDGARFGPVRVGDPAPAYAEARLDGEREALSAYHGRPVLLNVWATWCHPCREEIPALEALHREYAPRGLAVLGVSIDQGGQEQQIREFLAEYGASYGIWLDPSGDVQSTFSTIGVPTTYLIGPTGTVLWTHVGPVREDDAELRRLIEESLPAAT
jgi:cytochrome c biogenesis protein CcmG, thiol:disulfide interchange protein DsbE